jgi:Tol biopolymer transport system component
MSLSREIQIMSKLKVCAAVLVLTGLFVVCAKETESQNTSISVDIETLKPEFPFKGQIVFQSDMDGDREIYLLTKDGVKKLTDNEWEDEFPRWSPDGKKIAYSANPKGNYDIFVMDADGTNVLPVTTSPKAEVEHAWFPDGKKIAYTIEERKGLRKKFTLWMIDLETQRISRILEEFKGSSALPHFSPTAPLVAFTGKKTMGWDVYLFERDNKKLTTLTKGGKACRPHFSRDGARIAYVSGKADGNGDIWLMNPDGTGKMRLTKRDETADYFPSWSPDEEYIVFSSSLEHRIDRGNWSLFLVHVKTKEIIPLLDSPGRDVFPDWY